MAEHLYLYLPKQYLHAEQSIEWIVYNGEQAIVDSGVSVSASALESYLNEHEIFYRNAHVILPIESISFLKAFLPNTPSRFLAKALPYAIEEKLTQEVENVHISIGTRASDGHIPVAVVSQAQMTHYFDTLNTSNMPVDSMSSELFYVPFESEGWSILIENEDKVIIRTGEASGLCVQLESLSFILNLLLDEFFDNKGIDAEIDQEEIITESDMGFDELITSKLKVSFWVNETFLEISEQTILEIEEYIKLDDRLDLYRFTYAGSLLAFYSENAFKCTDHHPTLINLLHDKFNIDKRRSQFWQDWGGITGLVAACFVVAIIGFIFESRNLNNQAQQYVENTRILAKDIYGPDKKIQLGRLNAMVKGTLRTSSAPSSDKAFHDYMFDIGRYVSTERNLSIISYYYDEAKSEVTLEVVAQNIRQLDTLNQQILEGGYQAELLNANEYNDKFKGRIRIKG